MSTEAANSYEEIRSSQRRSMVKDALDVETPGRQAHEAQRTFEHRDERSAGVGPSTQIRFDLAAFGRAIEEYDVDYQMSRYAADAEVRIIDPDNPPGSPQVLQGWSAVRDWRQECCSRNVAVRVVHLVDGGDRVAFSEEWRDRDGTAVLSTSTAELQCGMITTQHTILVWDDDLN